MNFATCCVIISLHSIKEEYTKVKVAIVFEGGASRVSFTNGVIDVLLKEKIKADYIIGTSAGIGNGISFVSEQRGRNLEISMKYMPDKRYMGKKYLFKKNNRSYYNIPFVFSDVPNIYCPFDYDTFKKFGGKVYATVTNLRTGEVEYMRITGEDRSWKQIEASCALPLLFRPVEINGEKYMDGGVAVSVPFEKPIEDGCDKVIVVLTRERSYRKKERDFFTDLSAFCYAKYPKFSKKLLNRAKTYNDERERLYELEREGKVFIISPENTANWKRTESDPSMTKKMYCQGCRATKKRLAELREYLSK